MKLIESVRHWLLQKLLGDKFSYFEKDDYTILSNEKYKELKSIKAYNDIQERWLEFRKPSTPIELHAYGFPKITDEEYNRMLDGQEKGCFDDDKKINLRAQIIYNGDGPVL